MKNPTILDLKSLKNKPKELQKLCKKLFAKGKSLRSKLIQQIGRQLRFKPSEVSTLCRMVEYIHNSSLLHDDLLDRSSTRRNEKAAWVEFSPEQAVLAGDYLLTQTYIYLTKEKNFSLMSLTTESLISLINGEFLQREQIRNKTENLKITDSINNLKTSSLFKWSLRAPFLWRKRTSPALHKHLDQIGCVFGILFQRSDDLLDFSIRNKEKKTTLLDLKQNYLNSFSCFLLKNKPSSLKEKLRKARSLKEVHRLFPEWKANLQDFDQWNFKLIQRVHKNIEALKPFLKKEEHKLIEELKEFASFLYWRKG